MSLEGSCHLCLLQCILPLAAEESVQIPILHSPGNDILAFQALRGKCQHPNMACRWDLAPACPPAPQGVGHAGPFSFHRLAKLLSNSGPPHTWLAFYLESSSFYSWISTQSLDFNLNATFSERLFWTSRAGSSTSGFFLTVHLSS